MLLLSTLSACELGYIGPLDLTLRLRATFQAMDQLERHLGHFLNWYDTRNLRPLPPRYVSTVDSGNLASSLLAVKQGSIALSYEPLLSWQRWQGLLDTLAQVVGGLDRAEVGEPVASLSMHLGGVRQAILAVEDSPERWRGLLTRLGEEEWGRLNELLIAVVEAGADVLDAGTLRALRVWSGRLHHHLSTMQHEVDQLLPWLEPLAQPPA
ncbi:MAG: hypothetical protein GWN58_50305, partial [Anaerolineae bacterium]|nr:hypothetical protein [Anaerolineae bacterium]